MREDPGRGVAGQIDGRTVAVGARSFIGEQALHSNGEFGGLVSAVTGLRAFIAVDGTVEGTIEFADPARAELGRSIAQLTELGVRRTLVVSGDHAENVRPVANLAGASEVYGDLLPQDKVAVVKRLMAQGETGIDLAVILNALRTSR